MNRKKPVVTRLAVSKRQDLSCGFYGMTSSNREPVGRPCAFWHRFPFDHPGAMDERFFNSRIPGGAEAFDFERKCSEGAGFVGNRFSNNPPISSAIYLFNRRDRRVTPRFRKDMHSPSSTAITLRPQRGHRLISLHREIKESLN